MTPLAKNDAARELLYRAPSQVARLKINALTNQFHLQFLGFVLFKNSSSVEHRVKVRKSKWKKGLTD